jgi:hypothetical protein
VSRLGGRKGPPLPGEQREGAQHGEAHLVSGHRKRVDVVAEDARGEHVAQSRAGHATEHEQLPRADADHRAGAAEGGDAGGGQEDPEYGARSRRAARDQRPEGDDEARLRSVQQSGDRGFDMAQADADRRVAEGRVDRAREGDPA